MRKPIRLNQRFSAKSEHYAVRVSDLMAYGEKAFGTSVVKSASWQADKAADNVIGERFETMELANN